MLMSWTPYARIGRPLEAHEAHSPNDYLRIQATEIKNKQRVRPSLKWRDPFISIAHCSPPLISGGRWVVVCGCGNAPSYDPDWRMACCLECGAIYLKVDPPADWEEKERVVMARPVMGTRHARPDESLAELIRQNMERGDPSGLSLAREADLMSEVESIDEADAADLRADREREGD